MTPHIDGEHNEEQPVLHDMYYAVIDGAPVLGADPWPSHRLAYEAINRLANSGKTDEDHQ